jgi:hypothetical protein
MPDAAESGIFSRESNLALISTETMLAISPLRFLAQFARTSRMATALWLHAQPAFFFFAMLLVRVTRRGNVYNILWVVVFGFATLNILSLAARRVESNRRGMSFGEMIAVMVVLLSVFLLGWELLGVFHLFPLKLHR